MAKVLTICILPIRDRPRHFHKLIVFLIDSRVFQKFSSSLFLASTQNKNLESWWCHKDYFMTKRPSQRDPLFPNANVSLLSLFTFNPENAPKALRVSNRIEQDLISLMKQVISSAKRVSLTIFSSILMPWMLLSFLILIAKISKVNMKR